MSSGGAPLFTANEGDFYVPWLATWFFGMVVQEGPCATPTPTPTNTPTPTPTPR
jgi:hypothetical protein